MTARQLRRYREPMKLALPIAAAAALLLAAPAAAAPKLSKADRAAITRSIDVFVNHAVKRADTAAAYGVVAPEMRPGISRKQWSRGDIPVYPFPARGTTHPWNVLYVTREEVGLDEIAGLPLIGHWTCRVLPRVEAELRAQGLEPNFVFRSDIITTVQALVGAGVGSAIIPRLGVDPTDARTTIVELGPGVPVQPRVISLFWHRDRYRSPATLGFIEAAHEVCAEISGELDGTVQPLVRRSRSA